MTSLQKKYLIGALTILLLITGGIFFSRKKTPIPIPLPQIVATKILPEEKLIGTSVEGREIRAFVYGTGTTHLLFVGGIHGGYEWNSVLLAYQVMDYLKENPDAVPKNITVTIIPSANPDGLSKVIQKEGRFSLADVPTSNTLPLGTGRFNANNVDLNRNFDCKWQPKSMWRSKTVSAGSKVFSEPEAVALRDFIVEYSPQSVVFWHSMGNSVYASQCKEGIIPETLSIMNVYAKASGYNAIKTFDTYQTTGDAESWLASIGIPSITVELKTHETVELSQNIAGIKALFKYYTRSY